MVKVISKAPVCRLVCNCAATLEFDQNDGWWEEQEDAHLKVIDKTWFIQCPECEYKLRVMTRLVDIL